MAGRDRLRRRFIIDSALSLDGESRKQFGNVAVIFGDVIGPTVGGKGNGDGIVSVTPTVFAGDDRPGKWGIKAGVKVLGF